MIVRQAHTVQRAFANVSKNLKTVTKYSTDVFNFFNTAACLLDTECGTLEVCRSGQCINPCEQPQACGMNAECIIGNHIKQCSCPSGFTGNPDIECIRSM